MIVRVTDKEQKATITRNILESLKEWFEVDESREGYIRESADLTLLAAEEDGKYVGFLCLRETGKDTVEIAVTGILKEYQRAGLGRQLVEKAKELARAQGYSFMQVKTVKYGVYEDYDKSNLFYIGYGFKQFEVFPEYWDVANPCQVYIMSLK